MERRGVRGKEWDESEERGEWEKIGMRGKEWDDGDRRGMRVRDEGRREMRG